MTNKFIHQAQTGQNKWWQYGLTLLLLVTSIPLTMMLLTNFVLPALPETDLTLDLIIGAVGTAFISLIGVVVLYFTVKYIHKRPFSSLNYSKNISLIELFEGTFICIILLVITRIIFDFDSFRTFDLSLINYKLLYFTPLILICVGLQSYLEEVMFRGYLLQGFALKIKNKGVLFVAVGLLFSIIHFSTDILNLLQLFFVGLLLCFIVFRRGNLFFATGVHLAFNFSNTYIPSVFNQEGLEASKNTVMDWNSFFSIMLLQILLTAYILLKDKRFATRCTHNVETPNHE